jgi:hypothetical protein
MKTQQPSIESLRHVPLPTPADVLRRQAQDMAKGMGADFYILNGKIYHRGTKDLPRGAELISAPESSKPGPLGGPLGSNIEHLKTESA